LTYILCAGDSFTDKNYHEPWQPGKLTVSPEYPRWPELLAEAMGYDEAVNLGVMGIGNDAICQKVIDFLAGADDNPYAVVVLLSEAPRINILDHTVMPYVDIRSFIGAGEINLWEELPDDKRHYIGWMQGNVSHQYRYGLDRYSIAQYVNKLSDGGKKYIESTMRSLYILSQVCSANNVPLYIKQGISLDFINASSDITGLLPKSMSDLSNEVTSSPFYSKIVNDPNTFIDPYFFKRTVLANLGSDMRDYTNHPNAKGHQFISDTFIEFMNK